MKKRKTRNYGIFFVTLTAFIFIASHVIAGPNSRLPSVHKSTSEKKEVITQTDKNETDDTKSSSQKNDTNKTAVKDIEIKKNKTTSDDKVKDAEKKVFVKPVLKNKTEDIQPYTPKEKVNINPSNKKEIITSPNKDYQSQQKFIPKEKNFSSDSESILSSKSVIPSHSSSDNEMIRNYLKDHPHGGQSNYISPRQKLDPEEIQIEIENDNVEIIIYNNIEYTYYYGYYYRPWDDYYWRVWPPFGFRVRWLPPYYYSFWWRDIEYYYSCNVYYVYIQEQDEYVVVRPPIGAIVESIPDYSEKLIVDGETYFIADGLQYKAVLVNEEIWFKVIKVVDDSQYAEVEYPVGSLVEFLPDEREVIYIDDETYYISENVQFKAVIVNDEIWFQVLKVG